ASTRSHPGRRARARTPRTKRVSDSWRTRPSPLHVLATVADPWKTGQATRSTGRRVRDLRVAGGSPGKRRARLDGMTTLGSVFLPERARERLRDVVRAADDAGLEELWVWEDCFLEGAIATTSAALAWSSRLRVGIGLLPVPLRNVALTAMEVATLSR